MRSKVLVGIFITIILSMIGCSTQQVPTETPSIPQDNQLTEEQNTASLPIGSEKADTFYVEEIVRSYGVLRGEAINNHDFSLIENLLKPDSDIYDAQKKLISDLYDNGVQVKLIDFDVKSIQETEKGDVYKVYVQEIIDTEYLDKQEVETQNQNWIFTVTISNNDALISDIEEWNNGAENKSAGKITYENSDLGFKLSFPAEWKDYYLIDETPKDHIGVYFTGQSAKSKGENGEGLLMFFVFAGKINDVMLFDSIREIGSAHGYEYYYATGTDAPIGVLYINDDEIIDDDEKKLIQNDFAKYSSMMERDAIDNILGTFEEIPLT